MSYYSTKLQFTEYGKVSNARDTRRNQALPKNNFRHDCTSLWWHANVNVAIKEDVYITKWETSSPARKLSPRTEIPRGDEAVFSPWLHRLTGRRLRFSCFYCLNTLNNLTRTDLGTRLSESLSNKPSGKHQRNCIAELTSMRQPRGAVVPLMRLTEHASCVNPKAQIWQTEPQYADSADRIFIVFKCWVNR